MIEDLEVINIESTLAYLENEANNLYYDASTVIPEVSYKQKLYKLVIPEAHCVFNGYSDYSYCTNFKIVKQDKECITIKVGRQFYKIGAISSSDWLIINCKNVADGIGNHLYNLLVYKYNCDRYEGSMRVLIHKNRSIINVVTDYE